MGQWPLVVADYRREYGMDPAELAALTLDHFLWLLRGLSHRSRFTRAWSDAPKHMHDPNDRARLIEAARR